MRLDEDGLVSFIGRKLRKRADEVLVAGSTVNRSDRQQNIRLPLLFLLPGSLGYGPSLTEIASRIGKVARVLPVRYPDLRMILEGKDTLADMAAFVVQQIVHHQPSGDVRLLGHSLGGAVAFEVAARLLAAGRTVKFIGLLDTSIMGERSTYWTTVTRTISRIRGNHVTISRMACRALAKIAGATRCEARLTRLVDRHARGQFDVNSFRIKLELQEVMREHAYFNWSSEPKPELPLTVTLFRCDRKGMPPTLGWDGPFARVDVIPIAGGHVDLGMHPFASVNGPAVESALLRTYSPDETNTLSSDHESDRQSDPEPNDAAV